MTSYQFLPPLTDAEYEALRGDIAANGMRHPIIVDEKGKILDGHHRARIAAELDFKPEREVVAGLTEQDKRDLAFTMNTARRHMDAAQRRAAVIASLKADPGLSDRQHARRTGVSHPTVAGIRAELVAKGDVEKLSTRTDALGRQQPATRPTDSGEGESRVGAASLTSADHPREGEADARLAAARTAVSEAPTGAATPVGVGDEPEWPEIRKPAASSPDPHAEDDARRDAELDAELSATTTRFRVNFSSARLRAAEITNFDPDRVCEVYAANFDREVGDLLNRLGQWAEQVKEAHRSRQRAGLRLVSGGDR